MVKGTLARAPKERTYAMAAKPQSVKQAIRIMAERELRRFRKNDQFFPRERIIHTGEILISVNVVGTLD